MIFSGTRYNKKVKSGVVRVVTPYGDIEECSYLNQLKHGLCRRIEFSSNNFNGQT